MNIKKYIYSFALLNLVYMSTLFPITQTEAYLGIYQDTVDSRYGHKVKKYKKIIDSCIGAEKKRASEYYVFYHGQERKFTGLTHRPH